MIKVLIVEDEELVARMYEKALKLDGIDVSVALGGEDGLEKARNEKPDIILLDVMMPEPDGLQVLTNMKEDPETAEIPVVMLTNLSGKHDAESAMEKGAADYWVKSNLKTLDLGKKIKRLLDEQKDKTQ